MAFRLLVILAIELLLTAALAGIAGVAAVNQELREQVAHQAQQIRALEAQANGAAKLATRVDLGDRNFAALTARVRRLEIQVASSTDSAVQNQVDDLEVRLSNVESVLGYARLRYCPSGLIACVNSLELRFGP